MNSFKLVMEVNSNECLSQSAFAVVEVTQDFLRRVVELRTLCKHNAMQEVSAYWSPDAWDKQEELRLGGDSLVVSDTFFWFEVWPKHSSVVMDTTLVDIECLSALAEAGTGQSERAGMLFHEGILYCGNIPEELMDVYLDTQAEPAVEAKGEL